MPLKTDASGPIGLIEVLSEDLNPASHDEALMPFPQAFGTGTIQRFTLNPSLFVMIHRYTLTQDVQFRRAAQPGDQAIITFSFRNLVPALAQSNHEQGLPPSARMLPAVQVSSSDMDLNLFFPASTPINTIIIGIQGALLAQLLGQQAEHPFIQPLLLGRQSYLYEAMGSLAVQQIAADIMAYNTAAPLLRFYLTIKAQELLYQFISELLKRDARVVYPLRADEGQTLFALRARLVVNLSQPPRMAELASVAGMSESKLRRLFRQIFGMSLYDYFQTVRMHEAARLLRETKLSVSETGYQLGFTNLSHFSRLFKKHLGQKPKQYAQNR